VHQSEITVDAPNFEQPPIEPVRGLPLFVRTTVTRNLLHRVCGDQYLELNPGDARLRGCGASPGPRRIDSVRTALYNGSCIPASIHSLVEGWPSG
jgi:hypothetical protein